MITCERKRKKIVLALASLLTLASLTACASTKASSGASSAASTASATKELVVYSALAYTPAVAAEFKNETGVDVKIVSDSMGNLLAKAQAERNNPQ